MELILLFFAVFFVSGGGSWLVRRYLGARQFLADHYATYRLAAACSFLTGLAVALDSYLIHRDLPLGPATVVGSGLALALLPLWFAALLVASFLYRILVAPTLELAGIVVGSVVRVAGFLTGPLRTALAARRTAQTPEGPGAGPEAEREARRRREAARSRCEVFYALHAPDVGKRFTRAMLDDYLRRFLGDDRPPEEVEERAAALEVILRQHLEKAQPTPRFRSLADIAAWFDEQKRQIEAVPDDRLRQTLLAKLKARYAELTTQFLEEMEA